MHGLLICLYTMYRINGDISLSVGCKEITFLEIDDILYDSEND